MPGLSDGPDNGLEITVEQNWGGTNALAYRMKIDVFEWVIDQIAVRSTILP